MSKKSKLKYFIPGAIALIFGIAAFCMMFLPAITFTAGQHDLGRLYRRAARFRVQGDLSRTGSDRSQL